MSKVIRLTENDLVRLVKKVINEQTKSKKMNCFEYFESIGIRFVNDGGNTSNWWPSTDIPGYELEGTLTHDDYEPTLYIYKTDKSQRGIILPMDPKLINTIKSLSSTMGGKFSVYRKDYYAIGFQPGKCKEFGQFTLKLINQLKQFK
jgi:hypothetical protein